MTPDQLDNLVNQHTQLLLQMERIWTAFIILAFLGLLFLLAIFITAIWSVRSVNKRQALTEGKWNTLVELLIHNAKEHGRD